MSTQNISNLEENKKLKQYVFGKGIWKNYAFVPPSLVLFAGLFGLIYLYKEDLLLSWHSIPFIVIFALGTIWFKATRRYLVNKKIEETSSFVICASVLLTDVKRNSLLLFSTNNHRQNINYLEKQKKDLLGDADFNPELILNQLKKEKYIPLNNDNLFVTQQHIRKELFNGLKETPYIIIINNSFLQILKKQDLSKFKHKK